MRSLPGINTIIQLPIVIPAQAGIHQKKDWIQAFPQNSLNQPLQA